MRSKNRLRHAVSPEKAEQANVIQEIQDRLLKELHGGIWHTTVSELYKRIISTGFILPEPDIPNTERWSTSQGDELYPYVRSLGGVSLFDFVNFDPEAYSKRCPMSNWRAFVPFSAKRDHAVWIELHPDKLQKFISGRKLLDSWNAEAGIKRKIMPHIEAANIGPIAKAAFKRVLLVQVQRDIISISLTE